MTATQETPARDLGSVPDWGPVFTARPIHTGPDGRHLDDQGREYLATVIDGELTFAPVKAEWTTVPAVVQGDQVCALALGGVRVTPAVVKALVVPVLLNESGDLLLDTDEGFFWPSPAPTGRAPAALAGGGRVSPGQIVDAVHAAAIAEGLVPGRTSFVPGTRLDCPEVVVHFRPRATTDQGYAVLARLGVSRSEVVLNPQPGEPWSTLSTDVPVLGVDVKLFTEAAPGTGPVTAAGGTR